MPNSLLKVLSVSFILERERAAFSIGWGEGGALSELVIIPSQITIKIKNKLHFR